MPIVLAAVLWFGPLFRLDSTTGVGAAPVGACAAQTEPGDPNSPLEARDCVDPTPTLTVLAQVDGSTDCSTIAGTVHQSSVELPERRTCVGRTGADPNRSTDTAAAGECRNASGIERTACTAPDAATRILQRFDAVPRGSGGHRLRRGAGHRGAS